MSATFTASERLGDIVVKFPQAGEIFKHHGIDFCCGGDQPLAEAIAEHGVNGILLLDELNRDYEEARSQGIEIVDWSSVPLQQLIHHIVNTHHAYLQQAFPLLTELTAKVLRVHGAHHGPELSRVYRLFNNLRMDMEEHMIKEEEMVFPQIVAYENDPSREKLDAVIHAVEELDSEHDGAGDMVKELRKVTDNYALPEDACGTYASMFQKLQQLESDIFQHIHLENNVLFVHLLHDRQKYPVSQSN